MYTAPYLKFLIFNSFFLQSLSIAGTFYMWFLDILVACFRQLVSEEGMLQEVENTFKLPENSYIFMAEVAAKLCKEGSFIETLQVSLL